MTNQIAQLNDSQTMSSLEVAELTGKQHKHVLRDIRNIVKSLSPELRLGFKSSTYKDSTGKANRCYNLDKDSTLCLITGYDVNARMKIIKRWQELETESLMEMIDRLAITQCSFKREQPHFVYLISDGDYIKIGVTNDIDQRVQSLQTGNPNQLTILTCIPCENARYIEGMLHGVFDDFKMQGEWFNLSESQIKIAVEKINKYRLKTLVNSKE